MNNLLIRRIIVGIIAIGVIIVLINSISLPRKNTSNTKEIQLRRPKLKIALLLTTTNRYIVYVKKLVASAERYFLKDHDVEYHLWTNHKKSETNLKDHHNINFHFQEHQGWPMSAISRLKNYGDFAQSPEGLKYDYLYSIDADCEFVGRISDEVVTNWVSTVHADNAYYSGEEITGPEYFEDANWTSIIQNKPSQFYSQVTNTFGAAPLVHDPAFHSYVPTDYIRYYCFGFHGGERLEFVKRYEYMYFGVSEDRKIGHHAPVDDETYLNAANYKFGPGRVLTPAYMYPEPPRDEGHPWLFWYERDDMTKKRRKFRPRILNLTKDKSALMQPM